MNDAAINAEFVHRWATTYQVAYDTNYYDPYIGKGRKGDPVALRKLTEWKNPSTTGRPMKLSDNKKKPFQKFLTLVKDGWPLSSSSLRQAFPASSPVYAIFWHHVLFQTPIFDVHTNRAFNWFTKGQYLEGRNASIPRGGHWELYDAYQQWFKKMLATVQQEDASITSRELDRALFRWGMVNNNKLVAPELPSEN